MAWTLLYRAVVARTFIILIAMLEVGCTAGPDAVHASMPMAVAVALLAALAARRAALRVDLLPTSR